MSVKHLLSAHENTIYVLQGLAATTYTVTAALTCNIATGLIGPALMAHKIAAVKLVDMVADEGVINVFIVEVIASAVLSPVTAIFIAVVVGSSSPVFIVGMSCLAFAHTCIYIPVELLLLEVKEYLSDYENNNTSSGSSGPQGSYKEEPAPLPQNYDTPKSLVEEMYEILGKEFLNKKFVEKLDEALSNAENSKIKRWAAMLFSPDRLTTEQYAKVKDLYSSLNSVVSTSNTTGLSRDTYYSLVNQIYSKLGKRKLDQRYVQALDSALQRDNIEQIDIYVHKLFHPDLLNSQQNIKIASLYKNLSDLIENDNRLSRQ